MQTLRARLDEYIQREYHHDVVAFIDEFDLRVVAITAQEDMSTVSHD